MERRHFAGIAAAANQLRVAILVPAFLFGGPCLPAGAGPPPCVEFDAPFVIGCQSLPLKAVDNKNPFAGQLLQMVGALLDRTDAGVSAETGSELIEAVIPISARMQAGNESDLKQCFYMLVDCGQPETFSVADWLPRTQLQTEYANPIKVNNEHDANIGINLSAKYVVSATGQAGGQLKSGVAYEMLPPRETVLASGTLQHGHGIFFKIKPSSQTTMEGVKTFSAIFRVPRGWRGGCLRLDCEAVGVDRGVLKPLDRDVTSGRAVYWLALYRGGDVEAERVAGQVGKCQRDLLDSLAQHRHEARAGWGKSFSWSPLTRSSSAREKFGPPDEVVLAPDEVALLAGALDPAAAWTGSTNSSSLAVRQNLVALKGAAVALQSLPVDARPGPTQSAAAQVPPVTPGKPTDLRHVVAKVAEPRGPVSEGSPPANGLSPPIGVDRNSAPPGSPPRDSAPPASKVQPNVATATISTALGTNRRNERDALPAGVPPPSEVEAPARPRAAANTRATANAAPACADERNPRPAQVATNPSRQAWYLLASMWGALFTSIIGPVVVEYLRKRIGRGGAVLSEADRGPLERRLDCVKDLSPGLVVWRSVGPLDSTGGGRVPLGSVPSLRYDGADTGAGRAAPATGSRELTPVRDRN